MTELSEVRRRRHRGGMAWPAAREVAAAVAAALPARNLDLPAAIGCVLAEPLLASNDLPAHDNSGMDGWAVAGPSPWRVVGDVAAGRAPSQALRPGECMHIATGGLLPEGAERVLAVEDSVVTDTGVEELPRRGPAKQHVRYAGEEARAGDLLVPAGSLVTPPVAGLAAAAGLDVLSVFPRARVAVLLLGDELTPVGVAARGQVRDALGPQLPAWVAAMGATPIPPAYVADDVAAVRSALQPGEVDVVLTTGGTSRGAHDHLHGALAGLGADVLVDGVAVKPGHPMLMAKLPEDRWLVGLPGNPLAACAGMVTLVEPLLHRLHGRGGDSPVTAELTGDQPARAGDTHRLVPVLRTADERLALLPSCGSAMLRGLASASGLAVIPPTGAAAGDLVEYLPLPWTSAVR